MDSPSTTHGAAVTAEDFGLKGPRGWAFRGVSVTAEPGALVAVEGPSGSGRTCLLLALTGRMRATEGHAEVGGVRLPKKMAAVRRMSALGPVTGVNELDAAFTVAEHLRERALLQRRFDGSLRTLLRPRAERAAAARARIDAAMDAVGLDLDALPKGARTSVRDLERLEILRLSVGLALMGKPRLLAVDDLDLKLSDTERALAWELLRSVARAGTTVIAVCSEAPDDALRVTTGAGADSTNAAADPEYDGTGAEKDEAAGTDSTGATDDTDNTDNTDQACDAEETGDTGDSDDTDNTDDTEEGAGDAIAEAGRA
ncbi:ABC transporter ATP-binding protein [Streptomyces agglomeratus]|uniref:ABC transporter ATP-binding protein n=1 Tax=Streptomyces agglomeratus TaxID=285458 RepID=A0A1E5PCR1_9ACTN|nr:ATP-binding cassette domain-containing protein [Streptomyces agglomeratus]OEJ27275.1 ABC transporter ATP-binding protein [Streptomyces agglomeratus]OEJ38671.1 ABC transporter ATP-binding protein [Streptomyces agglomeratus]OEJ46944.1 ABC transporter ATP-binding protein [Streptomyces agglomeratus]OEJ51197.1 ABC transporter ATP-binding protein [Streptomyces agglomeratus]OEJ58567.1 ABC transporter ATP-binding protein [Streptomyces agglomeratus]